MRLPGPNRPQLNLKGGLKVAREGLVSATWLPAMAHPHPTTTWEAMQDGNTFYSKHQVYMMQWQGLHDLSDYIISVACHGGPIGE